MAGVGTGVSQGAWEVTASWRSMNHSITDSGGGGGCTTADMQAADSQSTAVITALSFWDYSLEALNPNPIPQP